VDLPQTRLKNTVHRVMCINKEETSMNVSPPVFNETRRHVAGVDVAGAADHYVCGPRNDDATHDTTHFGTTTSELHKLLAWLKERKVESVAMESTSVYWIPVADLLEANGIEVVLVDTREVRIVPGRKSDVKDCQWLQRLHSCGLLRGGFRPPEKITAIRTVMREKDTLVGARTQFIQQMQKSCDQMNIRIHHAVSDIDGATGMAIVAAIIGGERDAKVLAKLRDKRCKKTEGQIAEELRGTWREEHLFNLERAYRMLVFVDEQIALYDSKIAAMYKALAESMGRQPIAPYTDSSQKPGGKASRDVAEKLVLESITGFNMTQIAGVGYETAAKFISEVGVDLTRFPSERHFFSYLGLAPWLGKSAGKNVRQKKRFKNTSRGGRVLRMAAATLYRSNSELGAYFRSVARRNDRKTAIKATARRMAQIIYRALRHGVAYVEKGAEHYESRMREKTLRTVRNLIKVHGINELELASALNPV
jgi:transposase